MNSNQYIYIIYFFDPSNILYTIHIHGSWGFDCIEYKYFFPPFHDLLENTS